MKADIDEIDEGQGGEAAQKPSGKVRLLTLDDLDGRTLAARHVRDTRREVMGDLGGEERLSTLERAAVDHVALLDAMIKDGAGRWLSGGDIELGSITSLVNTFNRSASALGWHRRSKDVTPDLATYARRKQEADK